MRPRTPQLSNRATSPCPTNDPGSNGAASIDLPSAASQRLLQELRRVARFDSVNICLVGPSGTGKSRYAAEVHRRSPRSTGPLVKLNLAAVHQGFEASDLLGHVDGAFTGSRGSRTGALLSANGGTLILDEVTKASPQVQHILLQLFDHDPIRKMGSDREIFFDVRLIALTSVPLEQAVREGSLIPDLYERLKPFVLRILPLAKRRDDLPAILASAIRDHAPRFLYLTPPSVDRALLAKLERWPLTGNHREIDGVAQRLLANAQGATILHCGHLPLDSESMEPVKRSRLQRYVADQARAVKSAFGSVLEEARYYGVSVPTIHRWRKTHGTR